VAPIATGKLSIPRQKIISAQKNRKKFGPFHSSLYWLDADVIALMHKYSEHEFFLAGSSVRALNSARPAPGTKCWTTMCRLVAPICGLKLVGVCC
jgi:uncharacterized protein YcfL